MKASEIAEFVGGELFGDGNVEITSVADFSTAYAGDLAFFEKTEGMPQTKASCVIVPIGLAETRPVGSVPVTFIQVKNPKLAFAKAASNLDPYRSKSGWHETSQVPDETNIRASFIGAFVFVGEGSHVGEGAELNEGTKIGRNVTIGKRTIIHPNCVIYDGVSIGSDCILHAGVVVGADGFGFVRDEEGNYHKFPQIGIVVIEDNVEIGANACIDRGALGETRIGEGTKIDNLVQVGHNASIGKRCVIAAQTGISGSVIIEDDCVIGGQVGFGDHAHVKSGAVIGSQAGVLPGKIVRPGIWWGTPIQPLDEYKRQNAHVKSLERLKQEVKDLKMQLKVLQDG